MIRGDHNRGHQPWFPGEEGYGKEVVELRGFEPLTP